jgi:hypothetical protein
MTRWMNSAPIPKTSSCRLRNDGGILGVSGCEGNRHRRRRKQILDVCGQILKRPDLQHPRPDLRNGTGGEQILMATGGGERGKICSG